MTLLWYISFLVLFVIGGVIFGVLCIVGIQCMIDWCEEDVLDEDLDDF